MEKLLSSRYRILQPLGKGGFGATYLAEDSQMPSQRRCVVKQLEPQVNNPQELQLIQNRFGREATILEDVGKGHRQIPDLYAFFRENDQFYLVQEWIAGMTLTAHVQQDGVWSESAVRLLLTALLPVLDYIHSKGVIHRDIKPDNIILRDGDRTPVLIDFGAVKETMGTMVNSAGNPTHSIIIGTPGFMPQEQGVGRPVFASDLFSLGLTAIFLLTGKIPQELTANPLTGEILWRDLVPMVSPTFAGILETALRVHARDRYPTAQAMLQALQSNTIPATATSASPGISTQSPTVAVSPTPVTALLSTSGSGGFADWQKIIITGSVMGMFVLGAIALARLPELISTQPEEDTTPEEKVEQPDTTPVASSKPSSNPQPVAAPQPTVEIAPDPPQPSPTPQTIQRPSPAQFIREHYALLNQREYDATWQRLSTNFQKKSEGYSGYVNWWNKVARIDVGAVNTLDADAEQASVNAQLLYQMKSGKPFRDQKSKIYLIWSDSKQSWLIHNKTAP